MKKAKLKKLMLQAKEAHSEKSAALKKLSESVVLSKKDFARSKEELRVARKQHKDARKHFRKLEKALSAGQADRKEALAIFSKLEKKWRKLNKGGKPSVAAKRGKIKQPPKANIKVVPAQDLVATT
jgi:hypothetical protein